VLRHKGKSRTYLHNLRLAAILSFIAGLVNISGVLSVNILTTNVTGHFAFFAEQVFYKNYPAAVAFLIYILCFLLGAFTSNALIEISSRIKPTASHAAAMLIEVGILAIVGIWGSSEGFLWFGPRAMACTLLFAMGLQNALVTQVSQAVVRTTHLTGIFTDLGIELSQLFFYRQPEEKHKLRKSIWLRFTIIGCFFTGCVVGGLSYQHFQLKTLLLAAAFLVFALFYDNIRYHFYFIKRRLRNG
jgi:uncharacterized membrane protein YoaK (UPF0700 family)